MKPSFVKYIFLIFWGIAPLVVIAQITDTDRTTLKEVVVTPADKVNYFSTFTNGRLLLPNSAVVFPSVNQQMFYPYNFCYRVINTFDEKDAIGTDLLCIKTEKNYKHEDYKLVLLITNNSDYYVADTLEYKFSKNKNKLQYYAPKSVIPLPKDTFYITIGIEFQRPTPIALMINYDVSGYLCQMIDGKLWIPNPRYTNKDYAQTLQMKIFYDKLKGGL